MRKNNSKKHVILTLGLLIFISLILSACADSSEIVPKDLYEAYPIETGAPYTTLQHVSKLDGAECLEIDGVLGVFSEASGGGFIYNFDSGTIIKRFDTVGYERSEVKLHGDCFTVTELDVVGREVISTELYNTKGSKIAYAAGDKTVSFVDEFIIFDDAAYKVIETGDIVKAFDISMFSLPTHTLKVGDRRYVFETKEGIEDYGVTGFVVYDDKYGIIDAYEIAVSNCYMSDFHVLSNGNVLMQYLTFISEDDGDYDVYLSAEDSAEFGGAEGRYCINTELYDIEDKKAKVIDLDYMVSYVIRTTDREDGIVLGVENVLYATRFDEGVCYEPKLYAMTDDAKVGAPIQSFDGMFPQKINENTYVLYDRFDNTVLFDPKGKVIKKLSGLYAFGDRDVSADNGYNGILTSKYILNFEDGIYDYAFNELCDLGEDKEFVAAVGENAFLLRKETEDHHINYSLFSKGESVIGEVEEYGYKYYVTLSGNGTYHYYNEQGHMIGTYDDPLALVYQDEDKALFSLSNDEGTKYYIAK